MSVSVCIKQKSLFKKKLHLDDVIALSGLAYGFSDENYRLVCGEKGEEHTLLYDASHLARGIDLSFDGSDILLCLSLPTTGEEIRLFYHLIAQICQKVGTKTYIREGEKVSVAEHAQFIADDEAGSIAGLETIADNLRQDSACMIIFGIFNPLSIGRQEMERIGNRLDYFAQYLHEIQSADVYYAAPQVFRMTDKRLIGVYTIPPDVPSVVPTKPHIVMNQIEGIEQWYLFYEENMVRYEDFINFPTKQTYYDANHVVVTLRKDELTALFDQYRV